MREPNSPSNLKMRQIAFYGKGGIGKSTVGSNIAAALSESGLSVMMIGCDPKSDCTRNLTGEVQIPTILDVSRDKGIERLGLEELVEGKKIELDEVIHKGYGGVYCAECGGPRPGFGCAGRGVIVAIDLLKRLNAFEKLKPDVVIYDVPGDVVCGGFAMPLRRGLADEVYIVTSADYLALYAANNICRGISEFATKGGSPLGGIIYNVRGMLDEEDVVYDFAERIGSQVIGHVPNAHEITEAEIDGNTVIEYDPGSDIADLFREIAMRIYENKLTSVPEPLPPGEMMRIGHEIRKRTKEKYKNMPSRLHPR
jgi:nitrogenase iron protein NifH